MIQPMMDTEPQEMPLAVALAIVCRMCPDSTMTLGEVVRFMEFLINRPIHRSSAVEEAFELCSAALIEQYPFLDRIVIPVGHTCTRHLLPERGQGNCLYLWAWLDAKQRKYGRTLLVRQVDADLIKPKTD